MSELYTHLSRFDLNLLVSLDALLNERHVTRAAERMFVSQPTMSGMLQRLRDHFDDPLLVRAGRDLELTEKGRALQEPLRELLVGVRRLMAAAPAFDPPSCTRNFQIAMSDYVTAIFLPRLVRSLSDQAPHISLSVENVSPATFSRLSTGEIDLCVTTNDWHAVNDTGRADELESTVIFTDEFVGVACRRNTSAGDDMSVDDFCRLPHVLTQFGLGARTLEEVSVARAGVRYKARASMPSFSSVLELIPDTDCVALVQRRLALRVLEPLGLRMFRPPIPVPELKEALIWHPRYDFDPAHAWLRQLAITAGRELSPRPEEASAAL